jgi:hypothetical protein
MKHEATELRDVAACIERVAREHSAWSMVHTIVLNATDHICAMARVMETRRFDADEAIGDQ